MDLFEDAPADNTPEFSVGELSGAVKKAIEGGFSHVRVRGEVGRVSRPGSGHLYLDLKDDRAVLAAVIWKGRAQQLAHRPEEGMEVVATGKLTTFPGQSKYQMIIEDIVPAGAGALMAMLEKRKAALAAEGLFAPERKKPLPYLPTFIGVVTSPSGAVIRDILHRLRDRFPRKVLVWPVAVQGQRCAPEVAAAIEGFNRLTPGGALPRPDLLIVARGGGSLEDLWGFNEEIVARAAAASEIPLISAVGHETDTTLIDYVADRRAPTPTAAAELAVPVRMELMAWVDQQGARLGRALTTGVQQRQQRVRDLGRALPNADSLLSGPAQRLDHLSDKLPIALKAAASKKRLKLTEASLRPAALQRRVMDERRRYQSLADRLSPDLLSVRLNRQSEKLENVLARLSDRATRQQSDRVARLAALDRLRETLGYKATLERGYAVVRSDAGIVTRKANAPSKMEIEFADGSVRVTAE
ncbi:exodeoxyribonuclease VII large subunit [Loktanella sp. S4079]|uniref:exodeoxyribonuclease VII large subunit n=1 Tax=Loktanella sp. S4079 TaxID=579483 RepID=UPI000A939DE4|nr:exodeoxyribonuclease VII large subunit [Loktanella sp. S4079]